MPASQVTIPSSSKHLFRPAVAVLASALVLGLSTLTAPVALADDDSTATDYVVAAADDDTLTISQYEWSAGGKAERLKVIVTTTAAKKWKGTSSTDWLKVEKQGRSGTKATIRVKKNTTGATRTATATFTDGTTTKTVSVVQAASDTIKPWVHVSPPKHEVTAGGATSLVSLVTTNQDSYTATPNKAWVHVTQSGEDLQITVDPNTGRLRTARIVVRAGSAKTVIKIKQAKGAPATIDTSS
jgi:hypothetical protein